MSQAYESIASYVHQLVSVRDSSVTCLRNQRVLRKQIQCYRPTQSSRGQCSSANGGGSMRIEKRSLHGLTVRISKGRRCRPWSHGWSSHRRHRSRGARTSDLRWRLSLLHSRRASSRRWGGFGRRAFVLANNALGHWSAILGPVKLGQT